MKTLRFLVLLVAGLQFLLAQSEIPGFGLGPPERPAGLLTTTFSRASLAGAAGSGSLTVLAHRAVTQDRLSLELQLRHTLPGAAVLRIQRGSPEAPGPVATEVPLAGSTSGTFQTRIESTPATRAVFDDIEANPGHYYAALYDTTGAFVRGSLAPAKRTITMAVLSPRNEVPAVEGYAASATAAVIADIGRNAAGAIVSASITFDVLYRFPEPVTFSGMHVHPGAAGVNGPVVLDSGLRASDAVSPAEGSLKFTAEMDVTRPDVIAALQSLEYDPSRHYINLHTTKYPGGVIRAQLRRTEHAGSRVGCAPYLSRLEFPQKRISDSERTAWFLRDADGVIIAATESIDVQFDNYPADVKFTGFLQEESGKSRGGLYRLQLVAPEHLTSLDRSLRDLSYYGGADLSTADNISLSCTGSNPSATGSLRISGIGSPGPTSAPYVARGSIVQLYGRFPGEGAAPAFPNQFWPVSVNGLEVMVGGVRAPLAFVSMDQINAQVPFDLRDGRQDVQFWNRNTYAGVPGPFVSPAGPGIVVVPDAAVILTGDLGPHVYKANGTATSPDNPAQAGDVLTIYATGLGQTSPPLQTGQPAPDNAKVTGTFTVRFGNQEVMSSSAIAVAGQIGIYAVTVTVPPGVPPGMQPLVLQGPEKVVQTIGLIQIASGPVNVWFR